jgi:hypothetical protein
MRKAGGNMVSHLNGLKDWINICMDVTRPASGFNHCFPHYLLILYSVPVVM